MRMEAQHAAPGVELPEQSGRQFDLVRPLNMHPGGNAQFHDQFGRCARGGGFDL